jgi:putative ABC transport system permease protein
MLKNFVKTAIRHFRKQRFFSSLNLLGLTVGLATCLMISLYVVNELSYDRYSPMAKRLYRVEAHFRIAGENLDEKIVPAVLGPVMVRDFPSVQSFVRLHDAGKVKVKRGDQWVIENKACWADSNFFELFGLHALAGNVQTALTEPHSVVLSASMAERQFGKMSPQEVVGKSIEINGGAPYKIMAVIQDMPLLSHLHFDVIASLNTQDDFKEVNWIDNDWITYLLAKPGVTAEDLNKDLEVATRKYAGPIIQKMLGTTLADMAKKGDFYHYTTIPLTRIHLYSTLAREVEPSGNITYVRMFTIIAVFILLLACVNFMNLSTARSAGRSREVGIRKVLGSGKGRLIFQFLSESVLFSLGAAALSFLLMLVVLPYFSRISGQHLTPGTLPWNWLVPCTLGGALVVGCLAGSYPAFFLSSFQPIEVLKGRLTTGFKGSALRNVLVVFQFTTAIALIMSTMVIYRQISFIRNRRLGFDRSEVMLIPHSDAIREHLPSFKAGLLQLPGVKAVTMGSSFPTSNFTLASIVFGDAAKTKTYGPEHWNVDADYVSAMGMTMVKGRSFRPDMPTDSQGVMINETFAKLLFAGGATLDKVYTLENDKMVAYSIIGVVKDFNSVNMHQQTPPIMMNLSLYGNEVITAVRFSSDNIPALIDKIHHLYGSFSGDNSEPFEYSFMDEDFNNLYKSEATVGQIFTVFTGLAILIACLGLFGLVSYAAEQRSKELSIRKVLGAGVRDVIVLLARDFVLLILVSLLIALPLAWWAAHSWLETFAYRTSVGLDTFILAALATILAVVATIGYQAIKAATANPVDYLKAE